MTGNENAVPQADHLTVFFASQTGNAESISRNIYEQAQERGFKAFHHALNDHAKVDWDKEDCLVFVVSTTGDGDPPDNSTKFWRHLRKLKGVGLTKAKYTILGNLSLTHTCLPLPFLLSSLAYRSTPRFVFFLFVFL